MQIKFKKLDDKAVLPQRAYPGDAGLDLVATKERIDVQDRYVEYGTSLAVELPPNHVGLIFPRSSNSKKDVLLANGVGVLDENFRGEILVRFKNLLSGGARKYNVGDKVAQLVVVELPTFEIVESSELSDTSRGSGGFGSSGK